MEGVPLDEKLRSRLAEITAAEQKLYADLLQELLDLSVKLKPLIIEARQIRNRMKDRVQWIEDRELLQVLYSEAEKIGLHPDICLHVARMAKDFSRIHGDTE